MIGSWNLVITDPICCRSGNVTKSVAKPHERNLFLQSLSEEEQNPSSSNGRNNARENIEDKDLIESLENGVNFWTDYSKVQYHPQSLYELYGSWTDFDKFDNYGTAKEVVSEWSQMEEMNERLRFFVEECDHIQVLSFYSKLSINTLFTVSHLHYGLCSLTYLVNLQNFFLSPFC